MGGPIFEKIFCLRIGGGGEWELIFGMLRYLVQSSRHNSLGVALDQR